MKKIVLAGPSVRNNGNFVDAGETVEVGGGGEQIDGDRAKQLLADNRAMLPSEAKAADAPAPAGYTKGEQAGK